MGQRSHRAARSPLGPLRSPRGAARGAVALGAALALTAGVATLAAAAGSGGAPGAPGATRAPVAATPFPTLTVPAPVAPSATPAPKPSPKAKNPKKPTLAELRAKVAWVDGELERRNALVVSSAAVLDKARRELATKKNESVRARLEANRAHDELGRYAAAAYRGQQLSPVVTVLMGPPAGAEQTLRNLQNLEQAADIKTDITTYAADTAARADALEREAAALATTSAAATQRLTVARDAAKRLVVTTQRELEAEISRIAEVKARVAAKECTEKGKLAQDYPNGMIPPELLCSIGIGSYVMRGDAAVAFKKLAAAWEAERGTPMCVNSAYRTRAHQASLYANDPVMVAPPGRSHHGLGLALDLCGGIERFGSKQHEWMRANAGKYGFFHPPWAQQNGSLPEPWHWEFKVETLPSNDGTPKGQSVSGDTHEH